MNNDKQSQIMKIANKVAGAFGPAMAQKAINYMMARQDIAFRIETLKQLAANDNSGRISKHLLEQLADVMAFMSQKHGTSLDVMTIGLCMDMGVNGLHKLQDNQFKPALDYVLAYKAAHAM